MDFPDLEENLRQWSTKNKTTQRSLNELLAILRKQGHLLPKDARTLLATPRAIGSEPKCSGQYIYYGLEKGICQALICDAPARAYLKRIKNHNAYHSCERCITKGAYITKRVVFNEQGCTLRTDEAFSAVAYKNHQTGVSPFIAAGLSCVSSFVFDYMHMVNLGVVQRMLIFLTRGPTLCRLSVRQRQEISQKLNRLTILTKSCGKH